MQCSHFIKIVIIVRQLIENQLREELKKKNNKRKHR